MGVGFTYKPEERGNVIQICFINKPEVQLINKPEVQVNTIGVGFINKPEIQVNVMGVGFMNTILGLIRIEKK